MTSCRRSRDWRKPPRQEEPPHDGTPSLEKGEGAPTRNGRTYYLYYITYRSRNFKVRVQPRQYILSLDLNLLLSWQTVPSVLHIASLIQQPVYQYPSTAARLLPPLIRTLYRHSSLRTNSRPLLLSLLKVEPQQLLYSREDILRWNNTTHCQSLNAKVTAKLEVKSMTLSCSFHDF